MKIKPQKRWAAETGSCRPIFCALLVLVCSFGVLSQNKPSEAAELNARVAALFQKGDVDGAIPLAEKIVKIERTNGSSIRNLRNALENLAVLKLNRFKRGSMELRSADTPQERFGAIAERVRIDANDTEAHLREALKLAVDDAKTSTEQNVGIRNSLSWLLYNYIPPDPNQSLGFDKDSRDKFEMHSRSWYFKRVNESRQLYLEAWGMAESASNEQGDLAAVALFNLAEFELATGDFENALSRYEKLVGLVEAKYGKTSSNLLMPMESYAKLLAAMGQEARLTEVIARIGEVSGKQAQPPTSLLNLSLRAEKAFTPTIAPSTENDSRANKAQAELAGRRLVVSTAAQGGDVTGVSLATSTHGREYYDTVGSRGIKIRRVPVRVTVDESGKVIEAEGLVSDKEYKAAAEKVVKEWKFRSFLGGGQKAKMKGYVEALFLSN